MCKEEIDLLEFTPEEKLIIKRMISSDQMNESSRLLHQLSMKVTMLENKVQRLEEQISYCKGASRW